MTGAAVKVHEKRPRFRTDETSLMSKTACDGIQIYPRWVDRCTLPFRKGAEQWSRPST